MHDNNFIVLNGAQQHWPKMNSPKEPFLSRYRTLTFVPTRTQFGADKTLSIFSYHTLPHLEKHIS